MKNFYKFMTFCFIGGVSTLIDFSVLNLGIYFLGPSYLMVNISKILATEISMCWNFPMNRHFTFKAGEGKFHHQLAKYLSLYGVTSLFNFLIFSSLVFVLGTSFLPRTIAFVIATGSALLLNFVGSLFWTFKKRS